MDPSCVPQLIRLHSLSYLQSERLAAIKEELEAGVFLYMLLQGFTTYGGLFLPQLKQNNCFCHN